jgi:hypothetical protein
MVQPSGSQPMTVKLEAPPAKAGQTQPWKEWYDAKDLDTNEKRLSDNKPQNCDGMTQAVTNIG